MNRFFRYLPILFVCLWCSSSLYAQKDTLSYAAQFEQLMEEMDSMSIFNMIDSILSAEPIKYSELNFRIGYTSNVVSAGRNYGINQHGLAPAIAYYHKSGLFADVTGYWNSAFDPRYNLTLFSIGYFGTINHFSFIPSYEKWIYNNDTTATLSNSLGLNINQDLGPLNIGVDYSYLFGKESAHRLIGTVSGYAAIKDIWFFDRISFMPGISLLFGNEEITQFQFTDSKNIRFDGDFIYYKSLEPESDQQAWLQNEYEKLRNSSYSEKRKRARFLLLNTYANNLQNYQMILTPETQDQLMKNLLEEKTSNSFGLMNWSFSLPVIFMLKNFNITLSYSYNIPKALPGEEFEFDPVSYFGTAISYRIPFKK